MEQALEIIMREVLKVEGDEITKEMIEGAKELLAKAEGKKDG